jgi:hypothetical protein
MASTCFQYSIVHTNSPVERERKKIEATPLFLSTDDPVVPLFLKKCIRLLYIDTLETGLGIGMKYRPV